MTLSLRRLGYAKLSGLVALGLAVSLALGVVLVRAGFGRGADPQDPSDSSDLSLVEHKLPAAGSAGSEPVKPSSLESPATEDAAPALGSAAWVLVDWGATNGPEGFEGVLPEWFVSSYRVGGEFVESAGWFTPATWPADQPAFLGLSVARELWPHDLLLDVCFFDASESALYAGLSGQNMEFAPVSDNLALAAGR